MARKRSHGRYVSRVTRARATRLYRLLSLLAQAPSSREPILRSLNMSLRTFYREAKLLADVGICVSAAGRSYRLQTSLAEAEQRLPFPDPLLTFAEVRELAGQSGRAAERLAGLYREIVQPPTQPGTRGRKGPRRRTRVGKVGGST